MSVSGTLYFLPGLPSFHALSLSLSVPAIPIVQMNNVAQPIASGTERNLILKNPISLKYPAVPKRTA
jgi:hypothetical protein